MNETKQKCMGKLKMFLIESLLAVTVCAVLTNCEERSIPVQSYPIAKVSRFERDSYATEMIYGNSGLAEYNVFINNTFAYSGSVWYKPSSIMCTMNGVQYEFQLANTRGVSRVESVSATVGNAQLYQVTYEKFDPDGRLTLARVSGVADDGLSHYISYKYEGNKVIIYERGIYYTIELSDTDNTGYVCNVMGFSGANLTANYVFNPDFYFLNIYGTPIKKLPLGQEVEMSEDSQRLLRVGHFSYEY